MIVQMLKMIKNRIKNYMLKSPMHKLKFTYKIKKIYFNKLNQINLDNLNFNYPFFITKHYLKLN